MPIFDQGYQHWSGHLSGHAWRWLAITRQGVRSSWKAPRLRRILFVSWFPALLLAAVLCGWGLLEQKSDLVAGFMQPVARLLGFEVAADPKHYRVEVWTLCFSYFLQGELWFSMLLIMMVGPNLISQDLRFNALPLYFSRPLRRIDYFLGKLGVIGAFLGMVIIVPSIIAYVLGLLFSLDITIIRDTFSILIASVAFGVVIVICSGTLILALSSLSRNSRFIPLIWLAIWFVSGLVSTALNEAARAERRGLPATAQQAAVETDWRPLVSYRANLWRIGRQLLGTDDAWKSLRELQQPGMRERFLPAFREPPFPWIWSAGVMIILFGISVCILNFRIKSLDRLK